MKKIHRISASVMALSIALIAASLAVVTPAAAAVCLDSPAGLIARWPGDGTTADVAHGRNGTSVGGTSYGTGEVDQAFSFDGVDDTVSVPDDPAWSLPGDFTIETWVNFAGYSPVAQALLSQDEGYGVTTKWIFWARNSNDLTFEYGTQGSDSIPVSVAWHPNLSQWYHLAVTRSGSTFTLYIDGVAVDTGTDTARLADAVAPLTLGWGETDWFFEGRLDEPAIYQRALSGAEIAAIHNAGSTARCAIAQSTLSLTGPGTAYPSEMLHLDGTLGLSGGASVDGQTVAVSRTIDGGTPTALPDATVAADGTFSFEDTPGEGHVVYRATFAGGTNVSAESAFATVEVGRQTSELALTLSTSKVKFGGRVTIRAHLVGGDTNRAVTIWAVPYGAPKNLLKVGAVDANGNLAVRHKPTRRTEYYATYGGDGAWTPDTTAKKAVRVVPRWAIKMLGGYATVNGVRLFHYSSICGSSSAKGCPAARLTLLPLHPRVRVTSDWRFCRNGACYRDRGSFRLTPQGNGVVWVWYTNRSILDWQLSVRLIFGGDADHLGATSRWVKMRVTA